jgi:hypothetical protein
VCRDNQQFLKEVISGVLEGQGIGFWKTSRVKKLCDDENYRNFIVSRLNTSLDKKVAEDEQHLEDVVCIKFYAQDAWCYYNCNPKSASIQ